MTETTPGQAAYEAYCASRLTRAACAGWEVLPDTDRASWEAAAQAAIRAAPPVIIKARGAANRDKYREYQRAWDAANRGRRRGRDRAQRARRTHGMRPEDWAALCEQQHSLCYLCGEALAGKIVVDHDHDHCPRNASCHLCRRGLAHHACNVAIGFAGDDPAQLRRMADALEAAQQAYQARKTAAAVQPSLFG